MALLGTTPAKERQFAAFLSRIDWHLNDLSRLSSQEQDAVESYWHQKSKYVASNRARSAEKK